MWPPAGSRVILEPATSRNVDLLVRWTFDPVAQGPYKRVPAMQEEELRCLFLHSADRHYFLIRETESGTPLGRFYYREWHFHTSARFIDWELNLFIADPAERGKGYGTSAQQIASDHLLAKPETHSVFAYTMETNRAEQRALAKAGFTYIGLLPAPYYKVILPPERCVLYVRRKVGSGE